MAGAGAKKFAANSLLSSDDVNNYLADQVIMRFATSVARDAAFGGAGEPTLAEGMFCYLDDTNVLQSYTGSAWVEIASSDGKAPRGLVAYTQSIGGTGVIVAEDVMIGATTFTAVANRYYQIQYYESDIYNGGVTTITSRVRLNNVTGAIQLSGRRIEQTANINQLSFVSRIMTFTAGSITLVATMQATGGGIISDRSAVAPSFLSVTDLGAV